MAEKTLKTRIIQKHDTETNWSKATNFIPKLGEVIIYDPDTTHTTSRIKVGDGKTVVSSLPWAKNDLEILTEVHSISGYDEYVSDITWDEEKGQLKVTEKPLVGYIYNGSTAGEVFNSKKDNKASGSYSHAEGYYAIASGPYSHAQNRSTKAGYEAQTAMGVYNSNKETTLLEIGNGTSNTARSNAFEVYKDGHAEVQVQGTTDNSVANKNYVDTEITKALATFSIEEVEDDLTITTEDIESLDSLPTLVEGL